MTAREWPVEHARAWLLRMAADLLLTGHPEAAKEFAWQACTQAEWLDESRFRELLILRSGWSANDAGRAVAEVYAAAETTRATSEHWDHDRGAALALRFAAGLVEDNPHHDGESECMALAVGRRDPRLATQAGFLELVDEMSPWSCNESRIQRAEAETRLHAESRSEAPPDPIGELLAKLEAERLTTTPCSGEYCACILTENTIRRLTGREES